MQFQLKTMTKSEQIKNSKTVRIDAEGESNIESELQFPDVASFQYRIPYNEKRKLKSSAILFTKYFTCQQVTY